VRELPFTGGIGSGVRGGMLGMWCGEQLRPRLYTAVGRIAIVMGSSAFDAYAHAEEDVPAVRPLPMDQPVLAAGRAATFWEELPPHRRSTEPELAPLLHRLHALPAPSHFQLGALDPFVRIDTRIRHAQNASERERAFLLEQLTKLKQAWAALPPGLPEYVVLGDAWTTRRTARRTAMTSGTGVDTPHCAAFASCAPPRSPSSSPTRAPFPSPRPSTAWPASEATTAPAHGGGTRSAEGRSCAVAMDGGWVAVLALYW
jgi:hypothetical protein